MPIHNNSGLLLDTHVWIWLNNGSTELSSKTIKLIDAAAAHGKVFIPAISVWEVATLVSKKRIILRTPIKEWVDEALAQPGVNLVQLSPDISIESTQLQNGIHGDPADRLIVATARIKHLTILTRDQQILTYAEAGFTEALAI